MKVSPFRRISLTITIVVLLILSIGSARAQATRIKIVWLTDGAAQRYDRKLVQQLVDQFNNSQDEIELDVQAPCCQLSFPDRIRENIDPQGRLNVDIVGPDYFPLDDLLYDNSLDLKPLIDKYKLELTQYPQKIIDLARQVNKLIGLPFGIWPSVMYYNVELFDRAGLAYPPISFGARYSLDGKQVDWDWTTVAEVAKRLTIDGSGNNAKSSKFNPGDIVQFGFVQAWTSVDSDFSTFGDTPFWNPNTGKILNPPYWREQARWTFNGIWKDHFIPSAAYQNSDMMNSSHPFNSGRIAMARQPIWFSGIIRADSGLKWDLGVVPAHKGQYFSPTSVDTLRIINSTRNPDAAFKALLYLLAHDDLSKYYDVHSARADLGDPLLNTLAERYPFVKNWAVITSTLKSATISD